MRDILVFVYGTLKRGGSNHGLLRGAKFLGRHRTGPEFTMHHLGAYPGLRPGGKTAIKGELYAVDKETFGRLDRLEDYPVLYDRVRIASPFGGAWVYLLARPSSASVIAKGEWRERSARRPIG